MRIVAALALLTAAFALGGCGADSPPTATGVLTVEVENGQPVGGVQELTVTKDAAVRLEIEVDAPQEIHVHGYDLEAEATPENPAVFEFDADLEGIFEVESHETETQLAKLVVEP